MHKRILNIKIVSLLAVVAISLFLLLVLLLHARATIQAQEPQLQEAPTLPAPTEPPPVINGHGTGFIPPPMDLSHLTGQTMPDVPSRTGD